MTGFGERLKALQSSVARNQREFAAALDVPPSTVSAYISETNSPRIAFLASILDRYPQVSGDWLLSGQGAMFREETPVSKHVPQPEGALVPVLGEIPAGTPMERALSRHAEEHIRVDVGGLAVPGDVLFALRVVGESMVGAHILPGDVAVCSLVQGFEVGDVVAVYQASTGESTVKQLGAWDRRSGRVLLVPFNIGLAPFRMDLGPGDQVRRVVAVVRRLPARAGVSGG